MKKHDSAALKARDLDDRVAGLEEIVDGQSRDLRIQFDRIAQLQAEFDILRAGLLQATQRAASDSRTVVDPLDEPAPLTDEPARVPDIDSPSTSWIHGFAKPISWLRDAATACASLVERALRFTSRRPV